jgi:hypothetical protein
MDYPPTDESFDQLHRAGWSVGETAFHVKGGGLVWLVIGSNGENQIRAEGQTDREAWYRAIEQAIAVGMLAGWSRSVG